MRYFIDLVDLLFERFNPDQFLNRMASVMQLVRRGATEGERDAAREAFTRMMDHAREEIARMRREGATADEIRNFQRRLDQLRSGPQQEPPREKPKPPPEPKPLYKVGQWVVILFDGAERTGKVRSVNQLGSSWYYDVLFPNGNGYVTNKILRPATQDEVDAAMASRTKTTASAGTGTSDIEILDMARYVDPDANSNKVYGVLRRNGKYYTYWGGLGKALKVKLYPDRPSAYAQLRAKIRKGYQETNYERYANWLNRSLKTEFARRSE